MPKKSITVEAVVEKDSTNELVKSESQVSDFKLVTDIVVGKLTSNAKEYSTALKKENGIDSNGKLVKYCIKK